MISLPLFAAFALMTALAALAVLWPLSRARSVRAARDADLAVYRDQLEEIARDAKSGRLPRAEAEAARVEVARRMIAADAAREGEDGSAANPARTVRRRRMAALAGLVLVPACAVALYGVLGTPALPGAPLATRLSAPPDRGDVAILVRRVEEHLARNPDDGQGYEILAPVYLRIGRPQDAARAYGQAIRILGATADRLSARGEALMIAADGLVTADAARAFAAALELDPDEPRARFFLGLTAEQDGRPADAARIWGELAARSPANAPWRPMLAAALARVGGQMPAAPAPALPPQSGATPANPAPGPGAADVAAAASLSAEERNAMVRGMVTRLAERLQAQPDDLDGWLRLVRAYDVLGEKDKAQEALKTARGVFKDNAEALGRLDAAEKALAAGGKG